jgi:hypothetical protein
MPVTLSSAGQVKPAVTTTTFRIVYSRVIEVEPARAAIAAIEEDADAGIAAVAAVPAVPAVYRVTINYELADGSTVQADFQTNDAGLASADNTRIAAAKTAIKDVGYSAFARGKAGLPSGGTTT